MNIRSNKRREEAIREGKRLSEKRRGYKRSSLIREEKRREDKGE